MKGPTTGLRRSLECGGRVKLTGSIQLANEHRSLYEVQRLLGHADSKTTQRYAHLSPGALLDAANVVEHIVARSTAEIANSQPHLLKK